MQPTASTHAGSMAGSPLSLCQAECEYLDAALMHVCRTQEGALSLQ